MPGTARLTVQSALLVCGAALAILLAPAPPAFQRPQICADVVQVGEYAHILVNCDAGSFVELARDPSRVLEKNSMRQTRPGYAVLGWLLAFPFRAVHPSEQSASPLRDPHYAGYVALNFLLLTVSALLLAGLLDTKSLLAPAAIVPTAILLVNHITKAFLWTPHEQLFGLFVPMLSMWITVRALRSDRTMNPLHWLALGLATGVGCLVYGSFVLLAATVTIAMLFFARGKKTIIALVLLWSGTIIPLAAWHWFVLRTTGSFYSRETQYYHEFVWIAERWREGILANAVAVNANAFARSIPAALTLPIAFVIAFLALVFARNKPNKSEFLKSPSTKAATAYLVAGLLFYGSMGYYDPRLTATFIAPLIVLAGVLSKNSFLDSGEHEHSLIPSPVTLAAIAYVVLVIFIPGPYA